MSELPVSGNHCVIVVTELFDLINAQRKLLRKSPVEDRAMSSRCSLRFSIDSRRELDFDAETIQLLPHEIPILEKMVNELFGIYFEGEINKLCIKAQAPKPAKPAPSESLFQLSPEFDFQQPAEDSGIIARIKRWFGR